MQIILDELVRDLTKTDSVPKSEARRRILEYAQTVIEHQKSQTEFLINLAADLARLSEKILIYLDK